MNNPTHPQNKIDQLCKGVGIFNFDGKLVTKLIGGYELWGVKYKTPEEVLDKIKASENGLSRLIVNEGNFKCTNDGK